MTIRTLSRYASLGATLLILTLSLATVLQPLAAAAYAPGNTAFNDTWGRTDRPVLDGVTARTWMWGPEASTQVVSEPYAESPNGTRQVQYFDKTRMEINNPDGNPADPFYVTNGLLVVELITGNMQVGDNSFEDRKPALVNVAGDFDDPTGPTYATFGALLDAAPRSLGATISERVDRQGAVTDDPVLAGQGVAIAYIDEVTDHAIAGPFWDFMNANGIVYQNGQYLNQPLFENPFFATGRPVTEAYWANVKVGGAYKDVLMQCFERRCLTFTPGNPQGFIVEAGNVGQHYHSWRYADDDNNTGGNDDDGDETPVETATRYDFLTKFGLPAAGFQIASPNDVAVGPSGDVYVTDTVNRRVLKFNSQGIFVTAWGSQGTGNGQFENPRGIAVDGEGYVYVADKKQHRIQKFDANGAFVLAFGSAGSGDGELNRPHDIGVGLDGQLYVTETGNQRVQIFNANGGYLGKFGSAGSGNGQFTGPHGIDVGAGGLVYVVDGGNDRVQIFDGSGNWQGNLSVMGPNQPAFGQPMSVAVAGDGTVYVTDVEHDRIAQFTVIPVLAPAATTLQAVKYEFARFIDGVTDPSGAALAPNGRLLIADRGANAVKVYASTGVVLGGPLSLVDTWTDDSRGRFSPGSPRSVAVGNEDRVYATDGMAGKLKVFGTDGRFITQYGPIAIDNGNSDLTLPLQNPADVALDADGNIYIADAGLNQIIKLDRNGAFLALFGTTGTAPGQFQEPIAVTVDGDGNIYVADSANRRIQKFGPDFTFVTAWDSELSAPGQVDIPIDLTAGHGRVYVTFSNANARVEYFDLDGQFLGSFDGLTSIGGIALDADGFVFVGDGNGQVQKFSPAGELIASFGREGSGDGEFTIFTAIRVALDADGNVYATDSGAGRIQVFQPVS